MKAKKVSLKQLKRKVRSLQDDIKPLLKANEWVIRSYGEDKTVVRSRIEMVAKAVPTYFFAMEMCIGRAIPKWYTRPILKNILVSTCARFGPNARSKAPLMILK